MPHSALTFHYLRLEPGSGWRRRGHGISAYSLLDPTVSHGNLVYAVESSYPVATSSESGRKRTVVPVKVEAGHR